MASIGDAAQSYLLSAQRQWMILVFTVCGLLLRVLLGVALIREYGLVGACISQVVVSALLIAAKMIYAGRELHVGLPVAYGLRVLIASVLGAAVAWYLTEHIDGIVGLAASGTAFIAIFAVASVLLRCYSVEDLTAIEALARRVPGPPGGLLSGLARWIRTSRLYA
jgi:O-antigen/teichoic acid export membrane protein